MRILILGCTGMLGSTLYKYFQEYTDFIVFGSSRDLENGEIYLDAFEPSGLEYLLKLNEYDVVINCIGAIKQKTSKEEELVYLNRIFPKILADYCDYCGIKLIHISTDCVFDGQLQDGEYLDMAKTTARDLYGKTKAKGERIVKFTDALVLRTSIIGHEKASKHGLLEWFLSQTNTIQGYTGWLYSGFPTIEIAEIIHKIIKETPRLSGLYNLSSQKISKCELLELIKKVYKKEINIIPTENPKINRVLNSDKLKNIINYQPPSWEELINKMYNFQHGKYIKK